jgi:hypothetical protein
VTPPHRYFTKEALWRLSPASGRIDLRQTATSSVRISALALILAAAVGLECVQAAPPAAAATLCRAGAPNAAHLPGHAARITGWLHTCPDGTIRNSRGRKIRLLGLEYFRLGWGATGAGKCDGPWTPLPSWAPADISGWGFNSVELFFSWQNLEPTPPTFDSTTGKLVHHYDPAYLSALDSAIRGLTRKGLGVVLVLMQSRWSAAFQDITDASGSFNPCGVGMPTWIYEQNNLPAGDGGDMVQAEVRFFQNKQLVHDVTGRHSETMRQSFSRMWRSLASRYKANRRVVGVFPLFEPYDVLTRSYEGASSVTPATLRLAGFFEGIGRVIHNANPHLINFFAEQRSRTTRKWSLTRRPRIRNGAMTTEFYAGRWPRDGKRRLTDHYYRAKAWRYPLYIDEFDAFGMGRNKAGPYWRTDTLAFLAYAKKHQISWAFNNYPVGLMLPTSWTDPKTYLLTVLRRGF